MTLCESVICRFDQNNKSEALASFFCAFFAKIDWKDQPNPIRVGFYKSSFPAPIKLKSRKTIIVLQLFFGRFFQAIFSVCFFGLFPCLYFFWSEVWSARPCFFWIVHDLSRKSASNPSLPGLKFFLLCSDPYREKITKARAYFSKADNLVSAKYFVFWTFPLNSVRHNNMPRIKSVENIC